MMSDPPVDFSPLAKAIDALTGALYYWQAEPDASPLKPHLRSGVIQSFEFTYELAVRMLRRLLVERAASAPTVIELSFNDLLRAGADAGLLPDGTGWRRWRDLRNRTSHTYDEQQAQEIAQQASEFLAEAQNLYQRLVQASR